MTALPLRFVFSLGNALGFFAWCLLPNYRRLACHNVEIAFGREKTTAEKRRIVRRHFQRLGGNLLSGIKLNTMPLSRVAALVAVEGGRARAPKSCAQGVRWWSRSVTSVTGNCSRKSYRNISATHAWARSTRKLGNRYLDRFVRQQRARFGVELFDRSEGFQEAIRLLRGGGMIGISERPARRRPRLWTPFFGRLASSSPLPGLLCKRTGARPDSRFPFH